MNNIPNVFWLVPVASIVALGMAWYFFKSMISADEGTPRMREIAKYVRDGAMAWLLIGMRAFPVCPDDIGIGGKLFRHIAMRIHDDSNRHLLTDQFPDITENHMIR